MANTRRGPRWAGRQLAWAALIGAQFGLIEGLELARGWIVRSPRELAEVVALHGLVGLIVGLPILAAVGVARRAAARRWPRRLERLPAGLPGALAPVLTLFALVAAIVHVLYLPFFFGPVALTATALIVAVALTAALLWSLRPWGRRADRALLAALLAADLAAFLWGAAAVAPSRPAAAPGASAGRVGPDLFVVVFDTLRADHLGAYGYPRATSPQIDALAAESVVFERAYSTSNWTRPAVASLFTSTMPTRHEVVSVQRALSPELPQLTTALRRRGYRIGLFTVGANVEPADGYDRDVDHFYFQIGRRPIGVTLLGRHVLLPLLPRLGRRGAETADEDRARNPEDLTARTLEWVQAADPDTSLFVYVHYVGPHSPYRPPAAFARAFGGGPPDPRLERPPPARAGGGALSPADREQMVRQYDAEIRWHDRRFGELLAGLRAAGRLDDAVVVFTADHGEAFGEHGLWGHRVGLFDELVRVPLLVWRSGAGGARVDVPVGLIDLAPTLVELAGAEAPPSFDGGSLVPWLAGGEGAARSRTVFVENPENGEAGIRDERWAFWEEETEGGRATFLFRAEDRLQRENLAAELPEVVAEYRERLAERRRIDHERRSAAIGLELDADRVERLRALGYLQ